MRTYLKTILCLLLLSPLKVQANVLVINNADTSYYLQDYTSFTIANSSSTNFDNLQQELNKINLKPFSNRQEDIKVDRFYWGRIQIKNNLITSPFPKEWIIKFTASWTELDLFIKQEDGHFLHQRTGSFIPNKLKSFAPEIEGNFLKLSLPSKKTTTIYFHGKGVRHYDPPTFVAKIYPANIYYEKLKNRRSKHALFVGIVLMMLIYNIIFYFINFDKSYLYYSIYLLTFLFYTSFVSGDLGEFIQPILFSNHPEYIYLGKLGTYLGLMSYIAFIRAFLDLNKLLPKWDKYFRIFFWLGIPWMIIEIIIMFVGNFSYAMGDPFTLSYILLFVIFNFFFIFQVLKTKDRKGYFVVAGLTSLCLGILLSALEWGWSSQFTMIYAKVGSLIEIVIFSLGLAYRQWENQRSQQAIELDLAKNKLEKEQKQKEALRLKEMDQIKTDFYTNITHEFRTPLTIIQGLASQINGKYQQETKLIQRNTQTLLTLINQMLDLSKLESGNLSLDLVQGNVLDFLKHEITSYQSLAKGKNIDLKFHTTDENIQMDFDPQKVGQIISNLLSNAIKFIPQEGNIDVIAEKVIHEKKAQIHLVIKDTGIGISEQQLTHVFERFFQVKNKTEQKVNGTGIGLALTKELVELMNGSISIDSKIGQGTSVIILLPITNDVADIFSERSISAIEKTTKENNFHHPKSIFEKEPLPYVLIIEDNKDIIYYLTSVLKDNYQIITALNGKDGIASAIEYIPDIIISDIMMPNTDGYTVVQELKSDERTDHIPIILLTAKSDQASKLKGLKKGADAYLLKPFDKPELMIRMEKMIDLRKKLQERFKNKENLLKLPTKPVSKSDHFLQKLNHTIAKQLDNSNYNVTSLSADMNLSRSQLFRKTKAITGLSITGYIGLIRVQHGKKLLLESNLSISEIAYKVGFTDPGYFSKIYTKTFGYPPSEER